MHRSSYCDELGLVLFVVTSTQTPRFLSYKIALPGRPDHFYKIKMVCLTLGFIGIHYANIANKKERRKTNQQGKDANF